MKKVKVTKAEAALWGYVVVLLVFTFFFAHRLRANLAHLKDRTPWQMAKEAEGAAEEGQGGGQGRRDEGEDGRGNGGKPLAELTYSKKML